jgi:hypothetical protein
LPRTILALLAASALLAGVGPVAAQAGDTATAAKKCKKKRSAASAKKKCKKKGSLPPTPLPTPLPIVKPPAPPPPQSTNIDKVTLDWGPLGTAVDLDLHVWNRDGAHSGWEPAPPPDGDVYDGITGGTHSADGDKQTTGSEDYTDTSPSSHELTIVVCYQSSAGMDPTIGYTLTISYSDGTPDDVIPETGFDQGEHNQYDDGSATSYQPMDPCNGE